jgi:hypothetical protein
VGGLFVVGDYRVGERKKARLKFFRRAGVIRLCGCSELVVPVRLSRWLIFFVIARDVVVGLPEGRRESFVLRRQCDLCEVLFEEPNHFAQVFGDEGEGADEVTAH